MSPNHRKDSLKKNMIIRILNDSDTLLGGKVTLKKDDKVWEKDLPNNAFFISYQTYRSKQNQFRQEFETKFRRDFKKYLAYLKEKYPSL